MNHFNFFLSNDQPTIFSLPLTLPPHTIKERLGCTLLDTYKEWKKELFEIKYPHASDDALLTYLGSKTSPHDANWAYYPWRNEAIHIPIEEEFRTILFSRNFPIIEKHTQERLWNIQIGLAGLSVGSNIAIELVKAGVHKLKIADFDTLAPSNNNRITGGNIFQIGENKTSLLAKKLYELNPYCEIEQFPQGLTSNNFTKFVQGCDILIDEIDSFPIKNLLRDFVHSEQGKNTILLQGTDLGETPIVEIETHTDPKFGGRVNEKDIQFILHNKPNKVQATRMLIAVVGRENIPTSFLQNFINIKKGDQKYWAQVGFAATAVATKMASLVVEIARGNVHKLKRFYRLTLRETRDDQEEKKITQIFDKEFGYLPQRERTILSSDEAMLKIEREFGKKNILHLNVGSLKINIQEIPGNNITDIELEIIHNARKSYKMWGDDLSFLLNDPTDTKWEQGVWETWHLIASVDGPNNFHKTFALRKTYLSHEQLQIQAEKNILPLELSIWKIKNNKINKEQSLWDAFQNWIRTNNYSGNIVASARFCASSERKNESEMEKEATAITFATMQLLNSDTRPSDIIFHIITKKSPQKIFCLKHAKQNFIPAFHQAGKTFGLATSWKAVLDDSNPIYTFYATKVPKYWAQNPQIYITPTDTWRKSALNLLKAAKEKYG